jgi:hypothetical protein
MLAAMLANWLAGWLIALLIPPPIALRVSTGYVAVVARASRLVGREARVLDTRAGRFATSLVGLDVRRADLHRGRCSILNDTL